MSQLRLLIVILPVTVCMSLGCAKRNFFEVGVPEPGRRSNWSRAIALEAPLPPGSGMWRPQHMYPHPNWKLSGPWYGRWQDGLASVLMVEKLGWHRGRVVYTWGDDPQGCFQRGWQRAKAEVKEQRIIEFSLSDGQKFKFELGEAGWTLHGVRMQGDECDEIAMRKAGRGPYPPHSVSIPPADSLKYSRLGGGELDEDPTLIDGPLPKYPPLALEGGASDVVNVEIVIGPDGSVCCAEFVYPGRSLPLLLVNAALEAVRQWRFSPGVKYGKPVCCLVTVPIKFYVDWSVIKESH